MNEQLGEKRQEKRWKLIGALIAIFICGAVVGGVTSTIYIKRRIAEAYQAGPEQGVARSMAKLQRALNLDPEQQREIEPIVRELHGDLALMRSELGPPVRERIGRALDGVRGHLRGPQREDLDRHWQRMQNRFHPPEGKGPPHGGPRWWEREAPGRFEQEGDWGGGPRRGDGSGALRGRGNGERRGPRGALGPVDEHTEPPAEAVDPQE